MPRQRRAHTQSAFTTDFFTKDVAGGARELKKSVQQGGLKGGARAVGEGIKNIGVSLRSEFPKGSPRSRALRKKLAK